MSKDKEHTNPSTATAFQWQDGLRAQLLAADSPRNSPRASVLSFPLFIPLNYNPWIRILLHSITLTPLTTVASVISHNVELVVKILGGDKMIFQSNTASRLESKGLWIFKIKSEIPEECSIVAIHISDPSDDNVSVFHFKPVEVEPGEIVIKADKDRRFLYSMQIILLDNSELSFQLKAEFEIQETLGGELTI
ncbi:hypothetical protein M422DRAFT_272007 [Sphaerobolus stellatus SS14]|uniref:Uncharacterized protein n=1 Tax=Sphaerobolus stellatus (strain SS14) TaxID=990650 RepID=A0A0C9UN18_SPHS4|nr:hypothetical protein M422DRAFT_272007 [Sphaerobolus stellatus SS14]